MDVGDEKIRRGEIAIGEDSPWDAWGPHEVRERLGGVAVPWCVVAGWALEVRPGASRPGSTKTWRIAVPIGGFGEVEESALDGFAFEVVGSGHRWPLDDPAFQVMHQTWVRETDTGIYRLDIFREPHDGETQTCRRDERIRLPYERIIETKPLDGIPYLSPEDFVLLFKAQTLPTEGRCRLRRRPSAPGAGPARVVRPGRSPAFILGIAGSPPSAPPQPQGRFAVIIDAHSHILSLAEDPEFTAGVRARGSLCIYRSMGLLPSHRMPTEEEWEASGYTRKGWPVIGPAESLRDHPGFDKVVVLADLAADAGGSPDRHRRHHRGARARRPDAPGPLQRLRGGGRPDRPRTVRRLRVGEPGYRGVDAAVEELRRAVTELGLTGVKLYPMYQHWAANDPRARVPDLRGGAGARHPRDGPSGRLHADRRQAGARPSGAARRHRPRVPRPPRDHRALRAAVGRRGAVPPHEAPELLHRALVPDRDAHPPRPVPVPVALRADVRPAREDLLRHRLPGVPLRPREAAREAPHGERGGGASCTSPRSRRRSSTASWATTSRG